MINYFPRRLLSFQKQINFKKNLFKSLNPLVVKHTMRNDTREKNVQSSSSTERSHVKKEVAGERSVETSASPGAFAWFNTIPPSHTHQQGSYQEYKEQMDRKEKEEKLFEGRRKFSRKLSGTPRDARENIRLRL